MSSKHACPISLLLILAVIGFGPAVHLAGAQSLADIAKKEEERRKTIRQAAKVYTNKDLNVQPGGPPPPPPAATPANGGDAPKGSETTESKGAKAGEPAKDKSYWSGKLAKMQEQVERDQGYILAVQTRINSLTADFVNRDDPAQRTVIGKEREKALAELNRLNKAVVDGKKAIADFEEEARRAGVPPGWLR